MINVDDFIESIKRIVNNPDSKTEQEIKSDLDVLFNQGTPPAPSGALPFITTTVTWEDFSGAGLTSDFIFNQIPIGSLPIAFKMTPLVAFDAPNISIASLGLKDGANNILGNSCDLLTVGVGGTKGTYGVASGSIQDIPNNTSVQDITASLTLEGLSGNPTINISETSAPRHLYETGNHLISDGNPQNEATVVTATDLGGGDWELVIQVNSGDFSTVNSIAVLPMQIETANINRYTAGGEGVAVDDLTQGEVEIIIWYAQY